MEILDYGTPLRDGFGLKRRLPLCGGLQDHRVGDPLDCWGSDDATERPDARQSCRICYFPSWGSSVLKPDLSSGSLLLLEWEYLFWDIVYDKYYEVLIFIGSHLRDCHEFKKKQTFEQY